MVIDLLKNIYDYAIAAAYLTDYENPRVRLCVLLAYNFVESLLEGLE